MASVLQTERQTNGHNSSAPIVGVAFDDGLLPTDVLCDILLRLPAKPLCRLRAVCRSWRSLLSDSWFVAAHQVRQQPLVAVCKWGYGVKPQDIQILDMAGHLVRQMRVENCMLGYYSKTFCTNLDLLCLEGGDQRLRVLDPATGTISLLPNVIIVNRGPYEYGCYSPTYVVGRDGSTGETKVLAIGRELAYHAGTFCSVLTLGDAGGWRETGYPPTSALISNSWIMALVKGVLYFLVFHEIAMYDFDKEKWRLDTLHLPLPNERLYFLGELSDTLVASYQCSNTSMDLWFLTDSDKVIWSKQYTISMPPYQASSSPRGGITAQPLWLLDDGRIAFWVWHAYDGKSVQFMRVYDPTTHAYIDGEELAANYSFHAVYKGTLLRSSLYKKLSMYPATV
ncbi:putative F-box protein At3g23420 [Lolium perenne]|uniref:putative F-box protein At3g23420 n=1 Tax=Lolium perenne TaxID=4522 RepID=UPI0021F65DCE|nr:putative F-box protein At5g52610 [Lolium perenne]